MKVWIPNAHSGENIIGGGYSFIRNLQEGSAFTGVTYIESMNYLEDCDAVLVAGATMAKTDPVIKAKEAGKKIVLRLDNMPRNSRNRGGAFNRVKTFYELADTVVYQSKWAYEYIAPFFGPKKHKIILNGCNQRIFTPDGYLIDNHPDGKQLDKHKKIYLYSRHNRDETKRWEEAWYDYQLIYRETEPKPILWLCGRYSDEQRAYNFDFFNGEIVYYWGDIKNQSLMAAIYRTCDTMLLPYYNDACSNTLIEALSCGTRVIFNESGGNQEIYKMYQNNPKDLDCVRMAEQYGKIFG